MGLFSGSTKTLAEVEQEFKDLLARDYENAMSVLERVRTRADSRVAELKALSADALAAVDNLVHDFLGGTKKK